MTLINLLVNEELAHQKMMRQILNHENMILNNVTGMTT